MSVLHVYDKNIRAKEENDTDDVLGVSGSFQLGSNTLITGFSPIDTRNTTFLPLLIINEDDPTEWEVGLYKLAGSSAERGSGTNSKVIAGSNFDSWVNFSTGKKSYSVVDIANRFELYEIRPETTNGGTTAIYSLMRYDSSSATFDTTGALPLTDMSGEAVGSGLNHGGNNGDAFQERTLHRDTTSNATPKLLCSVKAAGKLQQITVVQGRVLISNQINTPIAKVQEFSMLVRYNSLSTATVVGTPTITTLHEDASLASATIALALSGTTIQVNAQGLASPSLQWTLELDVLAGSQ